MRENKEHNEIDLPQIDIVSKARLKWNNPSRTFSPHFLIDW